MCLGFPGKLIEITEDSYNAVVDIDGTTREVSLMMLHDEVKLGDYVMVHAGFAITKMDPEEALLTLETLREFADLTDEEA